ncbi:hypothetical protein SDC9_117688 [bioreactor metagenome]|uniref:Uncharacterized protein n=1 Tax=bioreactor metagenome TaxID=1076179 RepID=A0A645BZ09_9ZZZZ
MGQFWNNENDFVFTKLALQAFTICGIAMRR